MANVDTLPEILRPLMEGPSIETPRCAVCGAPWPLNRHHIVRRGAGKLFRDGREVPKPTVMLCGSGNGISMTLNKHQGIRAALCWTPGRLCA